MKLLFPPLPDAVRATLENDLPAALAQSLPLKAAHKRALPLAIAELSARLTSERADTSPYWMHPRLSAAYAWYFLPWNIIRLIRLLRGLPLPAPRGDGAIPVLLDLGSGPLTLPLALWLAFPQWRELPLSVICCDNAPQPLALGRRIFTALAGEGSPWRIVTRRAPLEALTHEAARAHGPLWLLSACNVLNEAQGRTRGGRSAAPLNGEDIPTAMADAAALRRRMGTFALLLRATLHAQAHGVLPPLALLVEPGTRLGGRALGLVREALVWEGKAATDAPEALYDEMGPDVDADTGTPGSAPPLRLLAPCLCHAACPLQRQRTWCHFSFDVDGAPRWLEELAQAAHLGKRSLSLSFLLAGVAAAAQTHNTSENAGVEARVVSSPLPVPGLKGRARYACAASGLLLLEDAAATPSGASLKVHLAPDGRRDAKTGAALARIPPPQGTRAARRTSGTSGEPSRRRKRPGTAQPRRRKGPTPA